LELNKNATIAEQLAFLARKGSKEPGIKEKNGFENAMKNYLEVKQKEDQA
jgi:hypothetical protein